MELQTTPIETPWLDQINFETLSTSGIGRIQSSQSNSELQITDEILIASRKKWKTIERESHHSS
jgi:hypothetical protein